jgi:hypothetical protein
MEIRELKSQIIQSIITRPVFSKYNGDELVTKCPFCGDNNKLDDGHLYIQTNELDDSKPMLYHCFKCNESGKVNTELLELLDIFDDEINSDLSRMNKSKYKIVNVKNNELKTYKWKMPIATKRDINKIQYIEKRLGIKLNKYIYDDAKIVPNLKDFLRLNELTATCKDDMLDIVSNNFVGFMTSRGTHIWFRNIKDSGEIRWYKYPIIHCTAGKNYYSIKTEIDILSPDNININLCEGVFDALSIAYNLCYESDLNIAVGSTDYLPVINHIISLGLVGDNITLNIYSDNDNNATTSIQNYRRLLYGFKPIFKEINIYYNLLEKDCGVPREKIRLKKEII